MSNQIIRANGTLTLVTPLSDLRQCKAHSDWCLPPLQLPVPAYVRLHSFAEMYTELLFAGRFVYCLLTFSLQW